jgi:hypothetical protein
VKHIEWEIEKIRSSGRGIIMGFILKIITAIVLSALSAIPVLIILLDHKTSTKELLIFIVWLVGFYGIYNILCKE